MCYDAPVRAVGPARDEPALRILIDYRPALRSRSGVGEYVHELARALVSPGPPPGPARREADQITLFSSSWRDRVAPAGLDGCRVVDRRLPVRLLNLAWHRLERPPVDWLARGDFDVVHSLHPLLMPARRAAQVVTVHDLDFLAHPERTRAEVRRDYPALAPRHVTRADHVIVNSRYTAAEVQRTFGLEDDRLTVCPPGAPAWTPRDPAVRPTYLLFLGTLEPRKNVGLLLDAYARLLARRPDVPELVLGGQATAEAAAWLARVAEPPLAGHARFVGYVAPERRRGLYEGAIALAVPSHHEGFGMPALEAMTVGVPVVATSRGALPEVVGDAGLLVEPGDAEAFAAALERVVTDPALASRLGDAGRERATRFSWRATAEAAREAYRRAIEHKARAHA